MEDNLTGVVLNEKYRLTRMIGRGGMGAVYEAEHTQITRRVAIKVLHSRLTQNDDVSERFLREAQTASSIGHRNIIEIHDIGRDQHGSSFMVMELLEGESLGAYLDHKTKLPPGKALGITLQVLAGLVAAHAKGVVHRDLKPDNIFLTHDSHQNEVVKILDFGISKLLDADPEAHSLTQSGVIMGTPHFMSPEQAKGAKHIDERADLWAMGVVLYVMLSGEEPFQGDSYNEIMWKIAMDDLPPLQTNTTECPTELAAVVERALSKDISDRYQSATDFIDDLWALRERYEELRDNPNLETLVTEGSDTLYDDSHTIDPVAPPDRRPESPVHTRKDRPPPAKEPTPVPVRSGRSLPKIIAITAIVCALAGGLLWWLSPSQGPLDGNDSVQKVKSTIDEHQEAQINTYVDGIQLFPTVAAFDDGRMILAWESQYQDGSKFGIFARWYDAQGKPLGDEQQVNTHTEDDQAVPKSVVLTNERILIAWNSKFQDGDEFGVFGQLYKSDGTRFRSEFQLNTYTVGKQERTVLAALTDGKFMAVWQSENQDGDQWGVFGQRFLPDSERDGSEIQINTTSQGKQKSPAIGSYSDGRVVVVWESVSSTTNGHDIFGQRFDTLGGREGPEFKVNTYEKNSQRWPVLATIGDDRFVVLWSSAEQDGSGNGIYGQYFDAQAQRQGREFQVNTYTKGDQYVASVASWSSGEIIALWMSMDQDGSMHGAFGQLFSPDQSRLGSEFQVNQYTSNEQFLRSLSALTDRRFIAAWESKDQDGSDFGVFARIFSIDQIASKK